jgi:hypothetical protein
MADFCWGVGQALLGRMLLCAQLYSCGDGRLARPHAVAPMCVLCGGEVSKGFRGVVHGCQSPAFRILATASPECQLETSRHVARSHEQGAARWPRSAFVIGVDGRCKACACPPAQCTWLAGVCSCSCCLGIFHCVVSRPSLLPLEPACASSHAHHILEAAAVAVP